MIVNEQKMRTKKRAINSESTICKNKINTRKLHSKTSNESHLSSLSVGNNANSSNRNKPAPNTRAKSNCLVKPHSDPYAFSKIDDEDKIPLKRMKVAEKLGKEVGVNTSNFSTMTEPEYLGPCEPGTSIELQGIVWLETASGLLVINVTWRGRTYVGTLMDSTKYEFTPSLSHENVGKYEGRPSNRSTRGKKRQVGNPGNHFSLRSKNIRHSRRLSESLNSSNGDGMVKKLSTRQNNNLINYFDSANQSATASGSGDSDTDKNSYSKFSTNSKTRSVTRSITKLNKAALCDFNSNSLEENDRNLIPCNRENCFKRFVDTTAYKYHIQRCHDDLVKDESFPNDANDNDNKYFENIEIDNFIKEEPIINENELINNNSELHNLNNFALKTNNCKLNGIISKEGKIKTNEFEFLSDSEIDKNQNLTKSSNSEKKYELKITENEKSDQSKDIKTLIKLENTESQFQELSINLPKVSENLLVHSDFLLPNSQCSTREGSSLNCDDKTNTTSINSTGLSNKSTPSSAGRTSSCELPLLTTTISHSSSNSRTVTAPTVSIPVELINTTNHFTNSTITCPTLIRPKPIQNPMTSLIHSSQNRKFKSSKSISHSNGITESFQIPSSNPVIIKKRPLVPLKVSVNQTSTNNNTTNINRVYSLSSNLNVTSPNQSSRHIRSSSISPVTPILPATSAVISSSLSLTSTTSVTGQSINTSINNNYHNGQLSARRPSMTTNLTPTTGLSTLVSLKPIQPKPKSSQLSSAVTSSHLGINTTPYASSQSIIVPSLSGVSNIHVSHQRQILPSPISKSDCGANAEESLIHKIESLKNSSLKRKRRKPEKKIRHNFHESNRFKKFALNPIQPKHISNDLYPGKLNSDEFGISSEKYKTDEENSHSPGYSDLSETNDTPAPILEKEIDLKSGDCDKLIISTDFDRMSSYLQNNSSDNYDDPKDLSNKPPALMPAVLSSDLVNGSTNELDYRDSKPRVSRKKSINNKKTHKIKDANKGKPNSDKSVAIDWISITTTKSNIAPTSNRKSFQSPSLSVQQSHTTASHFTSKSPILSNQEFPVTENNTKITSNRSSVPSAISECVRKNKINSDCNNKNLNMKPDSTFQLNHVLNEDNGKIRNKSTASPNNTSGKFTVQALTSPQELVSRSLSFDASSTVPPIIPNIKLSNSILKN